jgi:hypothetical protein
VDGHAWDNAAGEHRVTLVKGDHRWTFRCARGEEAALLTRVTLLAAGDAVDLDWTDAALIARRLGRRLTAEIHTFVAPPEIKAPGGRRAS